MPIAGVRGDGVSRGDTCGVRHHGVPADARRVQAAHRGDGDGCRGDSGRRRKRRRARGVDAVNKLIEQTTKHYLSIDGENMKMLRKRLVHAAIFDPRAVGVFFLLRTALGSCGAARWRRCCCRC